MLIGVGVKKYEVGFAPATHRLFIAISMEIHKTVNRSKRKFPFT